MLSSITYLVIFLLFPLFPTALASSSDSSVMIHAPEEVAADTTFEAKIDVEVHNGNTQFCNAFRVYLATSVTGDEDPFFYHANCYLLHEQTLCDPSVTIASDYVLYKNTSFTVSIPADVGPWGKHYVLNAQTLQTDGSYYGATLQSNVFSLTNATGAWGLYQIQGQTLWGSDGIPCSGYSCVQKCAINATRDDQDQVSASNSPYEECANACPSVYIDPSSSRGGQPTASLTSPTSCSAHTATATTSSKGTESLSTTSTRSVAGSVGTNAASPMANPESPFLGAILPLAVYYLNG